MASVLFDCILWLFPFLAMSNGAFTATVARRRRSERMRAHPGPRFIVAAVIGTALIRLKVPLASVLLGPWEDSEGVTAPPKPISDRICRRAALGN